MSELQQKFLELLDKELTDHEKRMLKLSPKKIAYERYLKQLGMRLRTLRNHITRLNKFSNTLKKMTKLKPHFDWTPPVKE